MKSFQVILTLSFITFSTSAVIAQQEKGKEKHSTKLQELASKLKKAVENGDISVEKSKVIFKQALAKDAKGQKNFKPITKGQLNELGAKLKKAVADGTMTSAEAMKRFKHAARKLKGAGKGKILGGGKAMMKRGAPSFYSIVIGRLQSKDIELGEFTLDVDYVTSVYGDRRLVKTIVGKTVTVVGISGAWLDTLLLIKKGETIKLRSGTLNGTTISLSPKAAVLEKTTPFDRETYPIPPEEFRGFRGIVTGTIISKSDQGYELTVKVDKVQESFDDNKATKPASVEGRLLNMRGFYNQTFRKKFDNLRIGDKIRVGALHRDRTVDSLEVNQILEKLETK